MSPRKSTPTSSNDRTHVKIHVHDLRSLCTTLIMPFDCNISLFERSTLSFPRLTAYAAGFKFQRHLGAFLFSAFVHLKSILHFGGEPVMFTVWRPVPLEAFLHAPIFIFPLHCVIRIFGGVMA
jgi:hypothetical protein